MTRQRPAVVPWPLISEDRLGDYGIFDLSRSVRRSPGSEREHTFTRLDAPDWVNVIPVTGNGQILLIEQYRHGTDAVTVEIPGGTVDNGETPVQAAARELAEETGHRPDEVHLLGRVEPNPAFLSNTCWTFLALACAPDSRAHPDPSEEIVVHERPLAEFSALIDDGTIRHALVIAAHDHLQRAIARRDPRTASLSRWL